MAASDLISLSGLLDDAKCLALVRQHRWPEGARCPVCGSGAVIRDGHDDTQPWLRDGHVTTPEPNKGHAGLQQSGMDRLKQALRL